MRYYPKTMNYDYKLSFKDLINPFRFFKRLLQYNIICPSYNRKKTNYKTIQADKIILAYVTRKNKRYSKLDISLDN
jgi:hypothetical protein